MGLFITAFEGSQAARRAHPREERMTTNKTPHGSMKGDGIEVNRDCCWPNVHAMIDPTTVPSREAPRTRRKAS